MAYNNDYQEEEPPPPAFQVNADPSSIHIPTNPMPSVEAEVFKEAKNALIHQPNMAGFMNMNNMNNMMMPNMANMQNMQNMGGRNSGGVGGGGGGVGGVGGVGGAAMPFPILSDEFMNNMMNMAANMDMKDMNKNMAQNMQQNQNMQNMQQNYGRNKKPKNIKNAYNNNKNMKSMKYKNVPNSKMDKPNIRKLNSAPKLNINPYNNNNNKMNKVNNRKSNKMENVSYINDMIQKPKPKPKPYQPQPPPAPYNVPPPPQEIEHKPKPIAKVEVKQEPLPVHHAHVHQFESPIQSELVSMGFDKEYVLRACNLYKKKFKDKPLRLEVLTEIIIRLQQRDQSRNREIRAKSIDSVASPEPNSKPVAAHHIKHRSSFQGAPQQNVNNNAALQQSMSYDYNLPNNVDGRGGGHNNNNNMSEESVAISIIMPSSSIGLQACDIIIRKDQSLCDVKQLISTCLTDFDQYDESYALFHDDTGFIFTEFDVTIVQALQLMDVNVDDQNIVINLKIGRIVSKYIKLK